MPHPTLTGQPADADDLVQDAVLRAYLALGSFDGQHPGAWLRAIMRRAQLTGTGAVFQTCSTTQTPGSTSRRPATSRADGNVSEMTR